MELIVFILTYFLLSLNIIGYGYFFAKNITTYNKNSHIGYIGLYGIVFLTLISYLTNLIIIRMIYIQILFPVVFIL